ncbi:MAG: hypothetical protein Q9207_004812 [Kuettlingeria erythrocarpa]
MAQHPPSVKDFATPNTHKIIRQRTCKHSNILDLLATHHPEGFFAGCSRVLVSVQPESIKANHPVGHSIACLQKKV